MSVNPLDYLPNPLPNIVALALMALAGFIAAYACFRHKGVARIVLLLIACLVAAFAGWTVLG